MSSIARLNLPILFGGSYAKKIKTLFGTSLIAYWPLNEASGAIAYDASGNGRNGAYTGVDLANAAGPTKTKTMTPYFDGANDYCNVYTAGLASAFNGAEGSVLLWSKVYNAAVWTDATWRCSLRFQVDVDNYLLIGRTGANNVWWLSYKAGGIVKSFSYTSQSDINWVLWALSWSAAAGQVISYKNGVAGVPATGLGTWAGTLPNNNTCIGSYSIAPLQVWNGWLGHGMVLNRPATPAEILAAYNLGA